mmetsp:Transcript_10692/g.26223  ORF Transcript_10692/g.26223 Transcript_10692/m.26223 type:complete len:82 (-) Transcript_10692:84-329(-)
MASAGGKGGGKDAFEEERSWTAEQQWQAELTSRYSDSDDDDDSGAPLAAAAASSSRVRSSSDIVNTRRCLVHVRTEQRVRS